MLEDGLGGGGAEDDCDDAPGASTAQTVEDVGSRFAPRGAERRCEEAPGEVLTAAEGRAVPEPGVRRG